MKHESDGFETVQDAIVTVALLKGMYWLFNEYKICERLTVLTANAIEAGIDKVSNIRLSKYVEIELRNN